MEMEHLALISTETVVEGTGIGLTPAGGWCRVTATVAAGTTRHLSVALLRHLRPTEATLVLVPATTAASARAGT